MYSLINLQKWDYTFPLFFSPVYIYSKQQQGRVRESKYVRQNKTAFLLKLGDTFRGIFDNTSYILMLAAGLGKHNTLARLYVRTCFIINCIS